MRFSPVFISTLVLSLSACDLLPVKSGQQQEPVQEKNENIRRSYFENGKVKQEVPFDDSERIHGKVKKYYSDGKLNTEVTYVSGLRQGESVWYYKSGEPYRVTPYVNDVREGIQKKFYEDGKLMSEVPFRGGEAVPGLTEYYKDGSVVTQPVLEIRKIDLSKTSHKVILRIHFSDISSKDEFYRYIPGSDGKEVKVPVKTVDGVAELDFYISRGGYLMEKVKIRGEKPTSQSNLLVREEIYNLTASYY